MVRGPIAQALTTGRIAAEARHPLAEIETYLAQRARSTPVFNRSVSSMAASTLTSIQASSARISATNRFFATPPPCERDASIIARSAQAKVAGE